MLAVISAALDQTAAATAAATQVQMQRLMWAQLQKNPVFYVVDQIP